MVDLRATLRRLLVPVASAAALYGGLVCLAPSSTESAAANGDTRTLHLYHTHTGETIDATFRVDGHYDAGVLRQLNHFLRDWRNNDEHQMDPRLFDAVWEAYRTAGATDRIQIYSAYRSPDTNAMLRRRSHAVAEHSQHMLGKAMDTTMPGFPMQRIREAGMKLQHGGVGWYPSSNFVHLDVGGVRAWPRMSYDQLARIFPDGKTVHIAADGRTLPGYDEARIQIAERGGGVEIPPEQKSSGFFAWLFGGSGSGTASEDEEDRRAPSAQPASAPVAVARAPAAPAPSAPTLVARAPLSPLQVASLDTSPVEGPVLANVSGAPMPPPRPTDLADAPEIPLPPIRPDALDRMQTASIRFSDAQTEALQSDDADLTAHASGVPMIRRSRLPTLITHGSGASAPAGALAFASPETTAVDLDAVPLPIARPTSLAKPLALRQARHRAVAPIQTAAIAVAQETETLAAPRLTGLRRAAHLLESQSSAL